ncbi:MAG: endonuclease III [candidate division Zixibacteria bacterium]|nr:endonuclease III [candidate division Zixibacteria bacterium]
MPREKLADKIARTRKIIRLLSMHYPDADCTLNFKTAHQLMVATILSAQCTDKRVNRVTPGLFRKYRSVTDFAEVELIDLAVDIRSTGFFNSKARFIKTSAQQLLARHGGKMPETLPELIKLTGIGRKTASVILGAAYGLAEGIVVDTHVGRISRRLKLTVRKDPVGVECDLMKIIPEKDWIVFSHLLIYHGREICLARSPACESCFLGGLCPSSTT